MKRARVTLGAVCVGMLHACGGQSGEPAAPTALLTQALDATTPSPEATPPPRPSAPLRGGVAIDGTGAGVPGAIVVVEVGGTGQVDPDAISADGGLLATTRTDPYIRYGAITDGSGAFSFAAVPSGAIGLHVLEPGYLEQVERVTAGADAGAANVLLHTWASDGGPAPALTGFSASPSLVAPSMGIELAVNAAASAGDPLSDEIFVVEPTGALAGALAPPTDAVPGGPYPNGVYNRIVTAPAAPGMYMYTAIAASLQGQVSAPVTVVVTVTSSGLPTLPDASFYDGEVFPEAGGLPDGRR